MATLSYDEAAHLLRRMGFGGSPAEIEELAGRGREGAVEYLLDYRQIENTELDGLLARSFDFSDPNNFERFNRAQLQRWWLTRMTHTRRQFEEKMTLFWHNFFATAASKVPDLFMYLQNRMLRDAALDRFDQILLRVAQDPAMLIWLDGVTNVRGNPNENFARELQELFSMGIFDVVTGEPNYTEQDVKEISRCFTGWKFFHPRASGDPFEWRFILVADEHDNTAKSIYGQQGNFSGEDVITILAARRATARFLVKKLFDFFVYPPGATAEDRATIEKFADLYQQGDHSVKGLVRAIFTSDEFFSDRARFALVKQPVELIIGAVRMLGARYNPGVTGYEPNANNLAVFSLILGQELFNPPDVAGWNLNLGWINTSTLLNRFTFADILTANRTRDLNSPGVWLSHEQLKKLTKKNPKKTLKKYLSRLGPLKIDPDAERTLLEYLEKGDGGAPATFGRDDATIDKKVRGLVHLIMCLAEFQLN
jgi:uncharacterized protein (DUF1800 family)